MKTTAILFIVAVMTLRAQTAAASSSPASTPTPTPALRTAPLQLRSASRSSGDALHFTLPEAEAFALANHPQIAGARLNAAAVHQEIAEARSQFFPQIYAQSDSVYAPTGTRLAADGALNNPTVFRRQSDGLQLSQLLFDFGHTYDLTEAAHFRADAAFDRLHVAQAVILLQVDRSYFDLLRAQALLRVAQETVGERRQVFNQISVLAKNQIKSSLDQNFAQVNLSEAQLLLIQGRSGVNDAEAEFSTALGFPDAQRFALVDEPIKLTLPESADALVRLALNQRPELASLRNEQQSADRFARAQQAARYPKISAMAAAGVSPVADNTQVNHSYYAAGINVTAPIFTGGDLEAQAREARLLSDAAIKNLVDAQNTISRDVRIAWEDAQTARDRLNVTSQLIQTAGQAEKLADARYRLGTSSIVELSAAQLNATQARLQDASARYDLQSALALLDFTVGDSLHRPEPAPTR